MKNRSEHEEPETRAPGDLAHAAGQTLRSYTVGALPILDRILGRTRIEEILREFMIEDKRCTVSQVLSVVVLVKNYLLSREPIYGVGEWARHYAPELLGLEPAQISSLNDDRVGRSLDRLFEADCPGLVLAITRQVVKEFGLDSRRFTTTRRRSPSTVPTSRLRTRRRRKARRPRPLPGATTRITSRTSSSSLTVSSDGAVPIVFGVENGNLTDDQTQRANWDLICQFRRRPRSLRRAQRCPPTSRADSRACARRISRPRGRRSRGRGSGSSRAG